MNGKPCASPGIATCWEAINWQKALAYVKKLQVRIVKAQKEGHYSKVKSLQWLLTHSFYAKVNKWKEEKNLQRLLAIEYVKDYCMQKGLSLEKLKTQRFELSYSECGFFQPSDVTALGLINDQETMPKATLTKATKKSGLLSPARWMPKMNRGDITWRFSFTAHRKS